MFYLYVSLCTLLLDEKKDDEDEDDDNDDISGLVGVESSRVESDCNNIIISIQHLRTHDRPCLHHPTPSITTSKRMSESSTQAVHTAAESEPKEKEKRKSTRAFPTQMESAQFTAKVSNMAMVGMRKCKDWQEN